MFSGIVEATGSILTAQSADNVLQIAVAKPTHFDDLHIGDSICTDGVCLTVESFDAEKMRFALGPETLKVTGWTLASVLGRVVNLERSLKMQDRIHGHMVTGHVDATGELTALRREGETQFMAIRFGRDLKPFLWAKGSVALNGVSLTINQCDAETFTVGLIPETLKRTALGKLQVGQRVNLEVDNMARGLVNWARLQQEAR